MDCSKCTMPIDEKVACKCKEDVCCHCCECEAGCSCGCADCDCKKGAE